MNNAEREKYRAELHGLVNEAMETDEYTIKTVAVVVESLLEQYRKTAAPGRKEGFRLVK